MSLQEIVFPAVHQHECQNHNGHTPTRNRLRGPLWPAVEMWTDVAPKRLRNKSACKTPIKSWTRWLEYLRTRKQPRPIERLLVAQDSPLAWGVTKTVREHLKSWQNALRQAKLSLRRSRKQKESEQSPAITELLQSIADWQHAARIADGVTEVVWAYQAVALARVLPELAKYYPTEGWWALVDELTIAARDAAALSALEQPLVAQLLAVELPLTLAYQLPELVNCCNLIPAAQQSLAAGIAELLDGEGVLLQAYWSMQRPLVTLWTRCRALQSGLPENVMDGETERQFTLAICELARAARADGTQLLNPCGKSKIASHDFQELLAAGYLFVPDLREKKAAAKFQKSLGEPNPPTIADNGETATTSETEKPRDYAASSQCSETAQVAIFRRSWKPRDPLLACIYDRDLVSLEIAIGRETIISGTWSSSLKVDGQTLAVQKPWREVCQISDADADYLELELQLDGGYKIQRQICLGRRERFVYLCDSVLGQTEASISYEQKLALSPEIVVTQDAEMRELALAGKKTHARILPLALPEWKSEQRQGELSVSETALTLATVARGRNLCSPWWIDLDPKRMEKPLTWRPLTIAETRVICPPDVARGWRVQIAEQQWIVYLALAGKGNRTILGHNLISEFLLAQFKNGTTNNLVEVE